MSDRTGRVLELLLDHDARDADLLVRKIDALYADEIRMLEREIRYAAGLADDA